MRIAALLVAITAAALVAPLSAQEQVLIGSTAAQSIGTSEIIRLTGTVSKNKTHNPMSMGGVNIFTNDSGSDYRIVSIDWTLDSSGVLPNEAVESDVAFTILKNNRRNSLDSGEELTATHSYYVHGAPHHESHGDIPSGGLVFPAGTALSIGSVSSFFPLDKGAPIELADKRLEDGRLMAMDYEIELQRADTVVEPPIYSYRSPYRDRGYVPDPNRTEAPYTSFRNTTAEPVQVYGLGAFYSMSSAGSSRQSIDVYINGELDRRFQQPDRLENVDLPPVPTMVPYEVTLQPGDIITAKSRVEVQKALIYDYVGFLYAGEGLEHINERLNVVEVDFNGDGYNDIVDVDARGSIWVSLLVGEGLQDTQDEWIRGLPSNVDLAAVDANNDGVPDLRVTNDAGFCADLITDIVDTSLTPLYCEGPAADTASQNAWGDFDGDGFLDHFVVRTDPAKYEVALGSPSGLGPYQPWAYGYGEVERVFVWDGDADGRDDVMAEWGGQCVVWRSTGFDLRQQPCVKYF